MTWTYLGGLDVLVSIERSRARITSLAQRVTELAGRASEESVKPLLEAAIIDLREALLMHFAKEQEGLFPFVIANAQGMEKSVARLAKEHEALSAAVVRVEQVVHRKTRSRNGAEPLDTALKRFNALYTNYAPTETRFLRRVDARLDDGQRLDLATLVRGL